MCGSGKSTFTEFLIKNFPLFSQFNMDAARLENMLEGNINTNVADQFRTMCKYPQLYKSIPILDMMNLTKSCAAVSITNDTILCVILLPRLEGLELNFETDDINIEIEKFLKWYDSDSEPFIKFITERIIYRDDSGFKGTTVSTFTKDKLPFLMNLVNQWISTLRKIVKYKDEYLRYKIAPMDMSYKEMMEKGQSFIDFAEDYWKYSSISSYTGYISAEIFPDKDIEYMSDEENTKHVTLSYSPSKELVRKFLSEDMTGCFEDLKIKTSLKYTVTTPNVNPFGKKQMSSVIFCDASFEDEKIMRYVASHKIEKKSLHITLKTIRCRNSFSDEIFGKITPEMRKVGEFKLDNETTVKIEPFKHSFNARVTLV